MGQVPSSPPYLLVGSGRLSRHLQRYLTLESVGFEHWDRSSTTPLARMAERARAVVVLISDDAIESFLDRHARASSALWIHCSGSISSPLAENAHPLMLFGDEPYELDTYRRIPFVCERGRRAFPELFPELGNPHAAIPAEDKPLYHALCALGGNGSTLLWQKVFAVGARRLGLDRRLFHPYLEQVARNLQTSPSPLTGPLVRGDHRTIASHLGALTGDPFGEVYRALVEAYRCDPDVRTV